MKNNQLTYIYQNGRKNRINKKEYPKEFFYGIDYISKSFKKTEIIEFNEKKVGKISTFLSTLLQKVTGLPFFLNNIINSKNLRIFLDSDLLVMTNQRVAFSSFPFLIINKILGRSKSSVFIMGLFDVKHKNIIKNSLRRINILLLMVLVDKLLFLSNGEYKYVKNKYKKLGQKSYFIAFPVDKDFWEEKEIDNLNNNLLFIGNDGKRDYEFILSLAKEMSEYNFTFITSKITQDEIGSNNINLIYGRWDKETLTDEEIKKHYHNSALTIIPIKDSLQPSGQSVALQSISCGTPVLITKTRGFWDHDLFINDKNIIFVEKNEIELWKNKINNCFSNKNYYVELTKKGKENITEHYDLNKFNKKLEDILFNY